jgi:hypothetical protein
MWMHIHITYDRVFKSDNWILFFIENIIDSLGGVKYLKKFNKINTKLTFK